jgi:hypothetical protein
MKWLCTAVFAVIVAVTAPAASTDGSATFSVVIGDPPGNYNKRVDAFWVTDSAGRFIQNVRKDANKRQGYLYKWAAARGSYTTIDGVSGATISYTNGAVINVTWDCRDTNNVIVADGNYRFYVEFTDSNGQGYWTTNGLSFYKGTTNVSASYPNQAYLTSMRVTYAPAIPHNLAVLAMTPAVGKPDTNITVTVTVTNKTVTAETFTLMLTNRTRAVNIGTRTISSMAGNTASNLTFTWNTAGYSNANYTLVATAGPVTGETNTSDNSFTNIVNIRGVTHDLGVLQIRADSPVPSNSLVSVSVLVTNAGDVAETVGVQLYDATASRLVGTNQASGLPSLTSTSLLFEWTTTSSAIGNHVLQAVAIPVSGETTLGNNTNTLTVFVGVATNVYVGRGSSWKYCDQGLDLDSAPWREVDYHDDSWSQGSGPLGYSADGSMTNIATVLNWGVTATNKFVTSRFRQSFNVDISPASLTLGARRDDGAVFYLNGVEVARMNMPSGAVGNGTLAVDEVAGSEQYTYFSTNIATTNLVTGRNTLSVELHRATPGGPNAVLDAELIGSSSQVALVHDVAGVSVAAGTDAVAGDRIPVMVTITNRGNSTESVRVFLKDSETGSIVGSQSVSDVHPGDIASVTINWPTLGASIGTHSIQAFTVVGGVTNFSGTVSNSAVISGSGFGLNAVGAVGSIGGRCAAIATTPNLLLVGAGATLEVWDRSNPLAPVRLGAVRLPGMIRGIATCGSYAFVACGSAGVQFVDLSHPPLPVHRNTFNTSGNACGVAVSGDLLYVADGVAGLRIVNVGNPAAPFLVGAYYTEGPARAVAVSGGTAFLLDQQAGLIILNTSSPGAPVLQGSVALDAGVALAVSGSTAYVVDENNHFYEVNVADPAAAAVQGTLLLRDVAGQSLALNGTTIHVAAGEAGIVNVNATLPSALAAGATTPTLGLASAVVVDGTTLYVADEFAGIGVYNDSTPSSPVLVSNQPTSSRASGFVVMGDTGYLAAGESGLKIYSLSNAMSPRLLGRFAGATNARCVAVSGSTAYVGDGQYGLKIVNVANPGAPSMLGQYSATNLGSIRCVGVDGSHAVVSDGRKLCLLNVSAPGTPFLASTCSPTGYVYSLVVTNSKTYAACGLGGLVIFSNTPGGLVQLGKYTAAARYNVCDVSVSGTNAYATMATLGWLNLDISNPAMPRLLKYSSAQGNMSSVTSSGAMLALGTATNMAVLVDASVPLTPVHKKSFGPLVRILRLASTSSLIMSVEDEAGLAVFSNTDDLDHDGMSDAWEQQLVIASQATNGPIHSIWDVTPGDDFDGDGAPNYTEYIAGTSAMDKESRFALVTSPVTNGVPTTIRWHSIAGKTYTIYKSTDLGNGFSVLQDNIPASPPVNSFPDTAVQSNAFYVIGVR